MLAIHPLTAGKGNDASRRHRRRSELAGPAWPSRMHRLAIGPAEAETPVCLATHAEAALMHQPVV
jgi:hypothetical protein